MREAAHDGEGTSRAGEGTFNATATVHIEPEDEDKYQDEDQYQDEEENRYEDEYIPNAENLMEDEDVALSSPPPHIRGRGEGAHCSTLALVV